MSRLAYDFNRLGALLVAKPEYFDLAGSINDRIQGSVISKHL